MRESAFVTVDEDARRRFESAWAIGQPEPIDRFLPSPDSSRYAVTLLELVLIELEMSWKAQSSSGGEGPRAEEYLARFPALKDPSFLSRLVQEEYLIRQRHGSKPALAEYHARFPDLNWTAIEFETAVTQRGGAEPELPNIPGLDILGVLGRGGMGVVYKACQTSLNRTVAVKQILSAAGILGADELTRFRNEAHAVARLQHPNIVQVHEVGQERGRPFLILEFVEGGTLAKRLAATPQPARVAAEMMRCLARAVQVVHEAGLLHRDLKPGNILLAADGTLKITDFGLTKRVADGEASVAQLTESGAIVGTPSYMAPEQASGRNREVGPAADIYALGAILYEMIVGFPPFRGETTMETIMQVVTQEPVPPRRLQPRAPRDLETICLKCLEKDPRNRYATAGGLADDLDRFLAGETIRARPVGAAERGWRWCRRKPALAALVLLLSLLCVGSAIGWFVWQDAEIRRRSDLADEARKKSEQETRNREQSRKDAETSRAVALDEVRAGRFVSARQHLRKAHDQLANEPDDAFARDIAEQFSRIDRLATFYHQADRAERFAFLESDTSALQCCELGLKAIGVFDHADSWWTNLPAGDLRAEQAAKLTRDVDHQLTLFAALWLKEGQDEAAKLDQSQVRQSALDALKWGERYREARNLPPSVTGRLLEAYIYGSQFRFDKIRRLSGQEPETASDCYFVGIALFWMAQTPDDWISKALSLTAPLLGIKIGEPKATAERLLRRAAADEPGHFWSHFWLGWCLMAQKDFAGAELSFTACTSLRPEEGLAYAERARVLSFKATLKEEKDNRDGLIRRIDADADRAGRFAPHEWNVHLTLLHCYIALGRQKQTLTAAGRMLELITLPNLLSNRSRAEQESLFKEVLPYIDYNEPLDPAESHSVYALACVLLKKDDEALRRAELAAQTAPNHPRVQLVRGILQLRKKDLPAAIASFRAVLAAQPTSFLAQAALSRAHELSGDFEAALRGYQALLAVAVTDGQRLAGHLGSYRNLMHLGRSEDAQKELSYAQAIDPKAAATNL